MDTVNKEWNIKVDFITFYKFSVTEINMCDDNNFSSIDKEISEADESAIMLWTVVKRGNKIDKSEVNEGQRCIQMRDDKALIEKKPYGTETVQHFQKIISKYSLKSYFEYEKLNWDWGIPETECYDIEYHDISIDDIIIENGEIFGVIPSSITNDRALNWQYKNDDYCMNCGSISETSESLDTEDPLYATIVNKQEI